MGSFDFFLLLCIICTFKWICQICLCNFRSSKHTFKCLFVWFVAVPLNYPYVPSSGFVLFLAVPYLQVSLPLICWWSFRLSIRTSKCSMGLSICTFKCFFFDMLFCLELPFTFKCANLICCCSLRFSFERVSLINCCYFRFSLGSSSFSLAMMGLFDKLLFLEILFMYIPLTFMVCLTCPSIHLQVCLLDLFLFHELLFTFKCVCLIWCCSVSFSLALSLTSSTPFNRSNTINQLNITFRKKNHCYQCACSAYFYKIKGQICNRNIL